MAKRDRKVLIVDADMRKPMQHKLFAIDNERGISSVLSGKHTPAECIFKLQGNLHIMPSGPIPANPSELIDSSVMTELISAMSQVYDYVIIDTPPIGIVTDASALAAKTDGVVLVARQKSTSSTELARAVEALKKVDVPILGAIFTDVSGYSKSYGKYRYKNGYRYRYKYRYDPYEYKEESKNTGNNIHKDTRKETEKNNISD
jgi:capsular exopolysaccharide synthesis family protein